MFVRFMLGASELLKRMWCQNIYCAHTQRKILGSDLHREHARLQGLQFRYPPPPPPNPPNDARSAPHIKRQEQQLQQQQQKQNKNYMNNLGSSSKTITKPFNVYAEKRKERKKKCELSNSMPREVRQLVGWFLYVLVSY